MTLPPRGEPANGLVVVGTAWVIAGGLVAAATGPLRLEHGSWVAAYQVLVAGVVQGALGVLQAELAPKRLSRRTVTAQLLAWNVGSVAVLGGTLSGLLLIVDVGGLLLVVTLALVARTVRAGTGPAWVVWTYRLLVVVVVVSIPVGLTLAHLRAP